MDPIEDRLLREVLSLPPAARAALAGALIESLEDGDAPSQEDVEAAWAVEIQRRWQALQEGKVTPIPWAEVRRQLLEGG